MGLFNRTPKPAVIATGAEIDAAGKALANGDSSLADQLTDRAGPDSQRVAMAILSATVDHSHRTEENPMTDVTIHDDENPDGRPATDEEITSLLAGMTTADGTSILDVLNDTRDLD